MREIVAGSRGSKNFSSVAMKLLNECGMISGAGSPDTAIAGFAFSIPLAPEATCTRAEVRAGVANAERLRSESGECSNPVSRRNRIKELFGSEFSAPGTSAGLSRVSRADVDAAFAHAGVAAKDLNLFEDFNV